MKYWYIVVFLVAVILTFVYQNSVRETSVNVEESSSIAQTEGHTADEFSCYDYIVKLFETDPYPYYQVVYPLDNEGINEKKIVKGNGFYLYSDDLVFRRGYVGVVEISLGSNSARILSNYGEEEIYNFNFEEANNHPDHLILAINEISKLYDFYLKEIDQSGCEAYLSNISELKKRRTSYKVSKYPLKETKIDKFYEVKSTRHTLTQNSQFYLLNDWKEAVAIKEDDKRLFDKKSTSYFGQFYVYWTDSRQNKSYYNDKSIFFGEYIWSVNELMNHVVSKILETPVFIVDISKQTDMNNKQISAEYLDLEAIANSLHLFANPEEGYLTHVGSFYGYQSIAREMTSHIDTFYNKNYKIFDRNIFEREGYYISSNIDELSLLGIY